MFIVPRVISPQTLGLQNKKEAHIMANKKRGRPAGSATSSAQISGIIGKCFETGDKKTIQDMANAISEMDLRIPVMLETAVSTKQTKKPRLSSADVSLMALISNPGKWFLLCTSKHRRHDLGVYGLGDCIDMTTRPTKNGLINHYARYTGGKLNAKGKARIETIKKRITNLRESVAVSSDPFSSVSSLSVQKKSAVEKKPKLKTTKNSKGKKSVTKKGSLSHAVLYPMTEEETTFLEKVITRPNMQVLVSRNTADSASWFVFRWKWESRYDFDLSQISITQRKSTEGMGHDVWMSYTPNKDGSMNEGLLTFVNFLQLKQARTEQKKKTVKPVTESVNSYFDSIRNTNSPVIPQFQQ